MASRHDDARWLHRLDHQFVEGVFGGDAERGRQIALRIGVDQQHFDATQGQARADINHGGRFADAALEVCDGDDTRHCHIL